MLNMMGGILMSWFTKFGKSAKQYGCDRDYFNYCCEYCGCKLEHINDRWECPVHKEKWYRW